MKWLFTIILIALVLFLANSPYDSGRRIANIRESLTEQTSTPMEIAIVWPTHNNNSTFIEGATLAVREINQRGGITIADENGKSVQTLIKMHVYDELADRDVVQQIADNPHLSAVIGHSQPDLAIRASVTYENTGLLFISPSVSDPKLNEHGFRFSVQTTPDDQAIANNLVEFALSRGWKTVALLYVRNTYGTTYANLLREDIAKYYLQNPAGAKENSILQLVWQNYYTENNRSFYLLISALLEHKFDALIIGDSLLGKASPRTLALFKQLREMGVNQPILGSEEFHVTRYWRNLGGGVNNIFAATLFDYQSPNAPPRARQFAADFQAFYGTPPTLQAGEAYEAVLLLAQAAERSRSKVPIKMVTMFKSTANWNGLQGDGVYSFSLKGAIRGKKVFVEEYKDGNFTQLGTLNCNASVMPSDSFENLKAVDVDPRSAADILQEK